MAELQGLGARGSRGRAVTCLHLTWPTRPPSQGVREDPLQVGQGLVRSGRFGIVVNRNGVVLEWRWLPLPLLYTALLAILAVALWQWDSWAGTLFFALVGVVAVPAAGATSDRWRRHRWPDAVLAASMSASPEAAAVIGGHLSNASLRRVGRRRFLNPGFSGTLIVRRGEVDYSPGLFSRLDGVRRFRMSAASFTSIEPAEVHELPGIRFGFADGTVALMVVRTKQDLASVCAAATESV